MAVDKTLTIDFSKLTPQGIDQINEQLDNISNFFVNKEQGDPTAKLQKDLLLTPKTTKEEGLRKIFGRKTFSNLVSFGSNPFSFFQGSITRLIPFIGTALLVTGVIAAFVKKVDAFQKEFVDNVDGRINLFRDKETQARVQAGLTQIIITTASGSAEPRDAYNTFTEFNENQSKIEADFRIRDTAGVD